MSQPLISILYPTWNVESFIDDAIRSVQAQTVTDWELVACDDASSDRTVERLREYAEADPRIRVVAHDSNVGMTANWNRALREARGEFVVKLDGDDAYRAETLERLLLAVRQNPAAVGAGVRTLRTDESLEPIDGLPADDDLLRSGIDPYTDQVRPNEEWLRIAVKGTQLWHSCAFMTRRTTLLSVGGFDERFGCASDTELLLRLLQLPGSFVHLAYPGVLYRRLAGSVSDIYRRQGWLRWEGMAANLKAISGLAKGRRLTTDEWRAYVLWWVTREELESRTDLEELRARTFDYLRNVSPPPSWRVALWKFRFGVSKLWRRRDPV